jgi:disulfide bond formation protein DsbB
MEGKSQASEYALLAAWLVALVATIGALYASEVLRMPVCALCWDQRLFVFPLAIQLGIATFRNDRRFAIYAIPLAALGGLFALYHYLIQKIPALAPFTPCRAGANGVSCEKIDWQLFGFITLPFLSLISCVLIVVLLSISLKQSNERVL